MKRFLILLAAVCGLCVSVEAQFIGSPYFVPAAAGANFTTSLSGHWKLNEASGNAADSSGNGTTLANNNTVTFSAAKLSNGGNFVAASSQNFSVADNAFVSMSPDVSFSVQVWAKITDKSATRVIVDKSHSEGVYFEFIIYYNSGDDTFRAQAMNGSLALVDSTAGTISTSAWYHLVFTYDAATDTGRFYVNAGTPGSGIFAGGNIDTSGAFRIGGYSGLFFNGLIDDVALWKGRALNSTEVGQLYNAGSGLDF